ncbi:MAG: phosphate acetyltransferase [Candidatus Omnitrophica bacterium]|nr:phosphate acetyltransferase [Candidatus Omnitrophota bacterium]
MSIFDRIYSTAKDNPKKIVLPEGEDPRIIEAAALIAEKNLARIILLGHPDTIFKKAKEDKLDISKIEIVDPKLDQQSEEYIQDYCQLRKHKGETAEQARDLLLRDFVYYGAMMLRKGRVDGFIAGAAHTTSCVARAAFRCLEKDQRYKIASSSFLMQVKESRYGQDGLFLFADCGIVPLPDAEQLATIALASAELWHKVTGFESRLAMLSFSSHGSSRASSVTKVKEACALAQKLRPDLIIDGELQLDSAIEPEVAKIKVPNSRLGGRANILIFPNLDAGNIAYKLMQRLAQARVVGPLIQGLKSPCSDLSRGCGVQEIVDAIAVTCVRAQ